MPVTPTHSPAFPRQLLALLACALLFVPACAKQAQKPTDTGNATVAETRWQLTPDAAATYYFLLLQDAKINRNDEAALLAYEQLLELDPSSRVFSEAADYFWGIGQLDRTISILEEGLKRYPDHSQMNILLAYAYYNSERKADALTRLEEYLAAHPKEAAIRQELANLLIQEGRYAEGLDALDMLPGDSLSPELRYFRAKALAGLNRNPEAIAELKKAVTAEPFFIRAWAELAYLYDLTKDYASAEQVYAHLLEIGEDSADVRLRLIELNVKLNNPAKAMEFFRNGPGGMGFILKAANAFLDEGFHEYAREALSPLVDQDDVPAEARLFLAVIAYEADNDIAGALKMLQGIPEDNHLYPNALKMRLQLLAANGRADEAIPLAAQGREKFASDRDFWLIESELLEDAGRLPEAMNTLNGALERWPDDTVLLYEKGGLHQNMKEQDSALAAMEKIIAIDPDHADALNFAGYLLTEKGRDLDRAVLMIRRANKLKPGNGYIIDSLAWVLFKMGDLPSAWKTIQQAVTATDNEPTLWEHYGDIARASGLVGEARKGYENALRFNHDSPDAIRAKLDSL